MKLKSLISFAALVLSAGFTSTALADSVTLTFMNPTQGLTPGNTISYTGTVAAASTNTGLEYLNGLAYTFSPFTNFTIDTSSFFNNYPFYLTAGQSYTGVLFSLTAPLNSAITIFTGNISLLGGSTSSAFNTLSSASVSTTVTPEPSSWLLLFTGLLGGVAVYHRQLLAR